MIAEPPVRSPNAKAALVVDEYARNVVAGEVIANRYVRLLAERHLRWRAERDGRDLVFDAEKAGRAIRFYSLLKLHEGEHENKPFTLLPWQAFVIGSTFGWYAPDEDGEWVRLIRNVYVETGKGSGKTPLGAGLCGYCFIAEGQSGAAVFTAAPSRAQSKLAWNDMRQMIAKSEALRGRVEMYATQMVGPKASTFTFLSSEAGNLHGPRVYVALIDEEHAHPGSDVIDAMRAGTKGWRNAIIFRLTNSGYDRHSICWQDHEYSVNVLEGVIEDDSWFGFVAGLDPCDEHRPGGAPIDDCPKCDQWTDESVWEKANPSLGTTITRRYLREQVREAIGKPAQRAVVKRLNFCIWTEGSGRWLDVVAFAEGQDAPAHSPLPETREAYGGLDIASTTDLAAFVQLAPRQTCDLEGHAGRCYDLRASFWLPEANLAPRVKRDKVPYDVWADEGWIRLTPGNRIDQERIVRDVTSSARGRQVGIDRWNTAWLTPALQAEGFTILEVGQGFASLSAPAKRLEADIAAHLVHHDGNPVLRWMVANAIADQDAAGNIKPSRDKSAEKIDGVAAWCDALFAWANDPAEGEYFDSAYDDPERIVRDPETGEETVRWGLTV